MSKINTENIRRLLLIAVACSYAIFFSVGQVGAETIEELQQEASSLEEEIEQNESQLKVLSSRVESLEVKVAKLDTEIAKANNEIRLTEVKLDELSNRLKAAEEELDRQKGLLKAALRALYERRGASTVELLIASDSFSDFISEQEYLERLQSAIKESADTVIELKQQIQAEQDEQERLLNDQQKQKNLLAGKQQEQRTILDRTEGEEDKYRNLVEEQAAALEATEQELAALIAAQLAAGTITSYGPVQRGQIIGELGSTGYSFGAHLHFMVVQNGNRINPWIGGESLINGYSWPVTGITRVTTPFGYNLPCDGPYGSYPTCSSPSDTYVHTGLDIAASFYTPVIAAADGEIIIRGCQGGLGYVVIVDHGGGWQTWYPHMVTPSGQISGYC